jgi:hypothetical protein
MRTAATAGGAVTLLGRVARRVHAYQEQAEPPGERGYPCGMDIAAVLAACDELAARIERTGLASILPADLSPKLMAPDA